MVNKKAIKISVSEAMFTSVTNTSTWEMAIKFLKSIVCTVAEIRENCEGQILLSYIFIYCLLTLRGKILTFRI